MVIKIPRRSLDWKPWFAWYPVMVPREGGDIVWLERIERKWTPGLWFTGDGIMDGWEYRRCE